MGARISALTCAAALGAWCDGAQAFRPFDGTDAAVAEPGQIEVEFAPAEYLREGRDRTLFAPSTVLNYGVAPGWEGVIEGRTTHGVSGGAGGASLVDSGVFAKGVLREGMLQEKDGPSIATEFGVLLPGIRADHGIGAGLAGILSQRWEWVTIHLNAAASLTRRQHADLFVGGIVEGPHNWPVRPVAEIFYQRDFGAAETRSALVGAIWQAREEVAIDFAVRAAHLSDHVAGEIRAGITVAFGAP